MAGRDRTGETYELAHERLEAVQVFLVVGSVPRMVPGNYRDRPVWIHTILALDSDTQELPSGHAMELTEDASCDTFTHYYRRIGSDSGEER